MFQARKNKIENMDKVKCANAIDKIGKETFSNGSINKNDKQRGQQKPIQ